MAENGSAPGNASATAAIQPRRDKEDFAFFDRPATLAAARRSRTPAPSLVMLTTDPWAMVMGADSPAFALYDDGTVLYRNGQGYQSVRLDAAERQALWRQIDPQALSRAAGAYRTVAMTDQPTTYLLIYGNERPAFLSVYGVLKDEDVRSKLPAALVAAIDRLAGFASPKAVAWLPKDIEVMIWPYEYAPEQSVRWPSEWPTWRSRGSDKSGDGYLLHLPSAALPKLKALLARRTEKAAVEIAGRKWSVAYRIPFPHEELWMAPKRD